MNKVKILASKDRNDSYGKIQPWICSLHPEKSGRPALVLSQWKSTNSG